MSCIRSLGGYLSIPVDKVEYTGIEYTNPDNQVTTVVTVDQTNRTIAVSVENLDKISAALLDPQPVSTINDSYILLCTVKDAERSYEWISYSELLNRITIDEEAIEKLEEDLSTEKQRAIDVETALFTELKNEITRAKSIEEEINSNLTKEINRATKSEEDLKKQIDDETSNRIEADNQLNTSLSQKIEDEQARAEGKETELTTSITKERERAEEAELNLSNDLGTEITNRKNADTEIKESISVINSKIPEQASADNQLADKNFVNSSIATSTATFRGTYDSVDDLPKEDIDNNDYAFVKTEVQTGLEKFDKYTYVESEKKWVYEYTLNNSSFTAAQWAAINSNITENLTTQITANKNSIEEEITRATGAETSIENSLNSHINNKENPHEVTKAQIGLDKVENTSNNEILAQLGTLDLEKNTLVVGPGNQVSN